MVAIEYKEEGTYMRGLGRWLQLNPEELERHKVATWRIAGSGRAVGYTLAVDGNAVLVGVVKARGSDANLIPLPLEKPREGVTLELVKSWTLTEAIEAFEQGEVTPRELNWLYRHSGGATGVSYTAHTEIEDIIDLDPAVEGVFIRSGNHSGYVHVDRLIPAKGKTVIIDPSELYKPARLQSSPLTQDGLPEYSFNDRMKIFAKAAGKFFADKS
ncbi:hypothetical protein [Corynebacterium gallinarum]|uniref:Uncharacterized protein n=1 Tax=Corynebacterium gallinarum TaxID=2762214 RepID=A0A8I0HP31_9CORY|nr:hypothetical protein [Corynebacterium gallinarum]MBD8030284.1 hypothetical protein [Corynebacterium gallinarum]